MDLMFNGKRITTESGLRISFAPPTPSPIITFVRPDNEPDVVDEITDKVWIARANDGGAIFNSVTETSYDTDGYSSPANVVFNNDGWEDTTNVASRNYSSLYVMLDESIGNNIVGSELIMWLIEDNKYFKIKWLTWTQGGNGGGFSYEREEITNYTPSSIVTINKPPYGDIATYTDYISDIVWISRNTSKGIYNSYSEIQYDNNNNTSPIDTEWNSINTDGTYYGWSDLTNLDLRTFDTWAESSNRYPPSLVDNQMELVMHTITDNKYYKVKFLYWTAGNKGGGFAYQREEIILDTKLKLEITTTSSNQSITIPHLDGRVYDYIVDYGDGTVLPVTSYIDDNCTHTYTTPGIYTLTISGICQSIYVNDSGAIKSAITKILQFGNTQLDIVNFHGCYNLTSISTGMADNLSLINNFFNSFYGCSSLNNLQDGMFKTANSVTMFENTFQDCTSLTSIPVNLFNKCINVASFIQTFTNCTSLTSIPLGLFDSCEIVTDFSGMFTNCTSLIGYAPELWWRSTGLTGTDCYANCTGFTNFDYIPISWGGNGVTDDMYKFVLSVPSSSYSYSLLHQPWAICDYIVDWGDNSSTSHVTAYNDPNRTHIYSSPGNYVVSVSGTAEAIVSFYQPIDRVISWGKINIKQISIANPLLKYIPSDYVSNGLMSLESFDAGQGLLTSIPNGLFYDCPNLTYVQFYQSTLLKSIPNDLFHNCPNISSFESSFYRCESLTSIPSGLFDNCTGVTNFTNTFQECASLTSIPSGLFDNCPNVTSFNGTFYNDYNITSIPSGLFDNCTNVTNFNNTFSNNNITSIPSGLFDNCPNVTSYNRCFMANEITSIPIGLFDNCPNVVDFSYVFSQCSLLTSIPSELFNNCTGVTTFENIFYFCQSLTSIPSGLFDNCMNVTNFNYSFYYCTSLSGSAPTLWLRTNPTPSGSNCFSAATGLSNYAAAQSAGWA